MMKKQVLAMLKRQMRKTKEKQEKGKQNNEKKAGTWNKMKLRITKRTKEN